MEFYLLRVTVHPNRETPLFAKLDDKAGLLKEAIQERPVARSSRGAHWKIANVAPIRPRAIYFRLGRERKVEIPSTNEQGDFIDLNATASPNTHVYMDLPLELCAVARQSQLSPTPEGLASALGRTLSQSVVARQRSVTIDASPIKEPRGFIERVRKAANMRRLWVVTRRPNPFDADEDFIKPTSRVLEGLGADSAKTEWHGSELELDAPETERIVRGAAATGGDAGATITEESGLSVKVRMTGDTASFKVEIDIDAPRASASEVLAKLLDRYDRIRQGK